MFVSAAPASGHVYAAPHGGRFEPLCAASTPQRSAQQPHHCVQLQPLNQGSAQQRHHCVQLQPFRGAHSSGSTACSFNPSGERTAAAPLHAASTLQGSALRAAQPQQRAAQPRRRAHNSACSSTPRRAAPVRAAPPRRGAHSIAHGANADVSTHLFCICKSTMLNMDCSNAMFGLLPLSGSGGGSGPLPPNGLCAGSGGEGDERRRLGRARVAAFLLRSSTRAGGCSEVFLPRCARRAVLLGLSPARTQPKPAGTRPQPGL